MIAPLQQLCVINTRFQDLAPLSRHPTQMQDLKSGRVTAIVGEVFTNIHNRAVDEDAYFDFTSLFEELCSLMDIDMDAERDVSSFLSDLLHHIESSQQSSIVSLMSVPLVNILQSKEDEMRFYLEKPERCPYLSVRVRGFRDLYESLENFTATEEVPFKWNRGEENRQSSLRLIQLSFSTSNLCLAILHLTCKRMGRVQISCLRGSRPDYPTRPHFYGCISSASDLTLTRCVQ